MLDPAAFGSASYPEPDGILPAQLIAAASVARRWPVAGLGITEFQHSGPPADKRVVAALRDAGLVSARPAGRSVLYARTSVAESVLTAAI